MESLAIFRDALEGVSLPAKAEPSRDDEDETVVRTPHASTIDLGKLPSSPLFCSLNKAGFEALVQKLDLRWVKAGETLVREGEQGDSMFVVVQGVVNVMHGDRVIAVMGEGAFFGEMALITDSPRLASVVAAKDGLLFEVHRARLTDIAAQHPSVSGVIAAFYRERLLANVLRASPVFRPLNGAERDDVAARFVRHSLPPLKEGDIFGEISVLLESPCTATVRTAGYCEVLELPREDFKRLVLPNPAVRALVKKVMTERISRTAELLERENTILPDYLV
jgi:cAMP-dependent protein kinase regulator